jgi:glucosylceramidase
MKQVLGWFGGAWVAVWLVSCGGDATNGGSPSAGAALSASPTTPGAPSVTAAAGPAATTGPGAGASTASGTARPTTSASSTPPAGSMSGPAVTVSPGTSVAPQVSQSAAPAVSVTTAPSTAGSAPVTPPTVVRPKFVTSAAGDYWHVGELTDGATGAADLSVDVATVYQDWLGFGGTFNEAGWDALAVVTQEERDRAIRLLFDANEGANFALGRIPMGASDYALERYTLNDNDGDYAMEQFSIDHDKQLLIPYIQAAIAAKSGIHFWSSPWSPPAWMKVNKDINGGRITDDPMILKAYALYFARFVEEYALEGIPIQHVLPQNEPGYETRYPSCLWTPELLTKFVRDHLGPTLEERKLAAEIWFGTMSAPEDSAHMTAVMADANAAKYVKGFALQWNTMSSVASLASNYKFPVVQSEHKCGNYPFGENAAAFNTDQPPNDQAYAEESWGLIRDWLKAGVNAYSAWNMVLDTKGHNSDPMRPWPQNALLTVDRTTKTLNITPAYYVFRHLSYFVDPGAVRVGTTGNGDALAFKNPDGGIVTVIYNSGGQAKATTLGVGSAKLQFSIPAHGWATVNWK